MKLPWHNPILLIDMSEIDKEKKKCKYFEKTGACKYDNRCLNSHHLDFKNLSMRTLIFPGMYMNMLMGYEILTRNLDSG